MKAYLIPQLYYPLVPLVNISNKKMKSLQTIHNKELWFTFNERYPFTEKTRTLHKEDDVELIDYDLYNRTKNILKKTVKMNITQMNYIKDNYEPRKNHPCFRKKTKLITERRPI